MRDLGLADYLQTYQAMQAYTTTRDTGSADQLWIAEHPPVYTTGLGGRPEHFPRGASGIPLHRVDRGGQVTFHGPGQVMLYPLLDLARLHLSVRGLVFRLEQTVIELLAAYGLAAERRTGMPGVYTASGKIAALGLRVRNGRSYHGLALNIDVSLAPYDAINPCGHEGLAVTRTRDLGLDLCVATAGPEMARLFASMLTDVQAKG